MKHPPIEPSGLFLSPSILFARSLFINMAALETLPVPKIRDEGDSEGIAA
jgi:hypothetical protein